MKFPATSLSISGERFAVQYRVVAGAAAEAAEIAHGIALEQTTETSADLLADDDIRAHVVGRIDSLAPGGPGQFDASISYAVECAGGELTQLLNVIFGNTAMQPGVRVVRLDLPPGITGRFKGPRFGREGIRELTGAQDRPLLGTALKPMGLPASELAKLAYQIALGGVDIIKEDHGLANQQFASFAERVPRCAEAVARANRETGYRCLYVPNVTAPADKVAARAQQSKEWGAGGVMLAPGITGWDTLRLLAEDDSLALPVLCHPALLGTYLVGETQGMAHAVVLGQLPRLAGADATIFVNYGGRFSFSKHDCEGIVTASGEAMGSLKSIFPIPSGGMTIDRLPEMMDFYGREAVFLIAGGLYAYGPDLAESSREFRRAVEHLTRRQR